MFSKAFFQKNLATEKVDNLILHMDSFPTYPIFPNVRCIYSMTHDYPDGINNP